MTIQTLFILIAIGIFAGLLSGLVGVGGGVIIVPALIYFLGLTQHQAIGTSLFILLLPVGILAVLNYYKAENINFAFGTVIAIAFVVGGYFGSKLSLKLSSDMVKIIFGFFLLYVAIKVLYTGFSNYLHK